MEQYLNPKNIEDYNKKEFWDQAFEKYKSLFDWYGSFNDFKSYFATYINKKNRILLVGCGNSNLGEKLYDNGYRNIVCIDYSETVIETMKNRRGKRETLEYHVMDATKMTFEDASFDVIIDKACLDAIYAEDNPKCKNDATAYLKENFRVLKPEGVLFTISMSQDFICSLLYDMLSPYTTDVYLTSQPLQTPLTNPPFLFITRKAASPKPFRFFFIPTDGFLRNNTTFTPLDTSKSLPKPDFLQHIQETRYYFIGRNKLRTVASGSHSPELSVSLLLASSPTATPNKYEFDIWDNALEGHRQPSTVSLLVPAGSNTSTMYREHESVWQLMEEAQADRMIIIFRSNSHARNLAIDNEQAKKDFSPILPSFLPLNGNLPIPIYSPPESQYKSSTLASGSLASGDSYTVEDVMTSDRAGSRRLLFTSNARAIQSQMGFHISGEKKKRKVFEPRTLFFSIHQFMAAALLLAPPRSASPRILVLGLGGGCLPSFLHASIPRAAITAVEIDETVAEIARKYFKLPEDVEVVVEDALQFVEKQQAAGKTYDVVIVDIDTKDLKATSSFPPVAFLTKKFLEQLKSMVGDGLVVYNICSRKKEYYAVYKRQFMNVFKNVLTFETEDLNQMFAASEGELRTTRTEDKAWANYLEGFQFPEVK